MPLRVLVTRPEPGASRTAGRLMARGCLPLVLPLSRIVALTPDGAGLPDRLDAVVATSANALATMSALNAPLLAGLPLLAVGEKTGEAGRRAGFSDIVEGGDNAASLARVAASRFGAGARLLYLCGKVRLPDFEAAMRDAGIDVYPLETYDTVPLPHDSASFLSLFGDEAVDVVLLYSREAALSYASLVRRPELEALVAGAWHLCLSARVASALPAVPQLRHRVAEMPNEDALFALMDHL